MPGEMGSFPTHEELYAGSQQAQMIDSKNLIPYAMWWEELLTTKQCDAISKFALTHDPYRHGGCNAITREIGGSEELDYVDQMSRFVNDNFFHFDLHKGHMSWHQTYELGSSYGLHADMAPGISRKLTAIVMLSDPDEYYGGFLKLLFHPMVKRPPTSKGTVIWIQPWLLHEVERVDRGRRESINMGFFGPAFR